MRKSPEKREPDLRARHVTAFFVLCALAGSLSACSIISDFTLSRKLNKAFREDVQLTSYMENKDLQVGVKRGVALVTGAVCYSADLEHAEKVARSVPGVKNLQIKATLKDCGGTGNPIFLNPFE